MPSRVNRDLNKVWRVPNEHRENPNRSLRLEKRQKEADRHTRQNTCGRNPAGGEIYRSGIEQLRPEKGMPLGRGQLGNGPYKRERLGANMNPFAPKDSKL